MKIAIVIVFIYYYYYYYGYLKERRAEQVSQPASQLSKKEIERMTERENGTEEERAANKLRLSFGFFLRMIEVCWYVRCLYFVFVCFSSSTHFNRFARHLYQFAIDLTQPTN